LAGLALGTEGTQPAGEGGKAAPYRGPKESEGVSIILGLEVLRSLATMPCDRLKKCAGILRSLAGTKRWQREEEEQEEGLAKSSAINNFKKLNSWTSFGGGWD